MSENLPVQARLAVAADLPFIRNSWLRNYHEHGPFNHVPNDVFFANAGHWGVVDRCLRSPSAVLVAHPEGDDRTILGWACAAPGVLHYVYTKAPFRRLGIARGLLAGMAALLQADLATCTHWTPVIREWAARGRAYAFNPYLLERA